MRWAVLALVAGCSFAAARTPERARHSCLTNRRAPAVDLGFVVAGATTAAIGFQCQEPPSPWLACLWPKLIGSIGLGVAEAFTVSTVYGMTRDRCASDEETRLARELTEHAAMAARSGDCASFDSLGLRIRELDRNVYEAELLEQPEIHRCVVAQCEVAREVMLANARATETEAERVLALRGLTSCE